MKFVLQNCSALPVVPCACDTTTIQWMGGKD